MRVRDQSGPPVLADVGHLHDLEHRLQSPWLDDKLGDSGQGFGGELACEAQLVPDDDNALYGIFEGRINCLQLLGVSVKRGY